MKHELVTLAGKIDWDWIDQEIAPLYSEEGRPGIETRFVVVLKHIFGLSDEGVCDRWVYDPYFQHFTGEEFFQHAQHGRRRDCAVHHSMGTGRLAEHVAAERPLR